MVEATSDAAQHWAALIGIALGAIGLTIYAWHVFRWFNRVNDKLSEKFEPNGGNSLADKINATDSNMQRLIGRFDEFTTEIRTTNAQQWDAIGDLQSRQAEKEPKRRSAG